MFDLNQKIVMKVITADQISGMAIAKQLFSKLWVGHLEFSSWKGTALQEGDTFRLAHGGSLYQCKCLGVTAAADRTLVQFDAWEINV